MRIYTKTGDSGETSLLGGKRVSKTDERLAAYGTLDELNAVLGTLWSIIDGEKAQRGLKPDSEKWLRPSLELGRKVQSVLFVIGSRLAAETEEVLKKHAPALNGREAEELERDIDRMQSALPELKNFIIPGGTQAASLAHWARTVARRAERGVAQVSVNEKSYKNDLAYINRLSDWLFVLSRALNHAVGVPDQHWELK